MTDANLDSDTIRQLVDGYAIRQLVDRYAIAMDDDDLSSLADLFVPIGALHVMSRDGKRAIGVFEGTGRDGMGLIADLMAKFYYATQHHITTHTVAIDGDTATGTTHCVAHHIGREKSDPLETLGVRYDDAFVRTSAGWKFRVRKVTRLWTQIGQPTSIPLTIDRAVASARAPGLATRRDSP